jgi:hypothetical protein
MAAYDDMIKKLPAVMKQTNVKLFYKSVGAMMDDFDELLVTYESIHLVDSATGTWLDNLGKLVGEERAFDSDEDYRARIKLEFYRYYYVPTLDKLLTLIKKFAGVYPDSVATQNEDTVNEKAAITMSYDFSPSFDVAIFDDMDKLAGGGIKLINDIQFIYYSKKFISGTATAGRSLLKRRSVQKYIGG